MGDETAPSEATGEGTPIVKEVRTKLTGSPKSLRQQKLDKLEEAAGTKAPDEDPGAHSSTESSATSGNAGQTSDAYNKY